MAVLFWRCASWAERRQQLFCNSQGRGLESRSKSWSCTKPRKALGCSKAGADSFAKDPVFLGDAADEWDLLSTTMACRLMRSEKSETGPGRHSWDAVQGCVTAAR